MAPHPRYVELIRVSGDAQEARDTPADQRAALDRLRELRPGILVERIDMGAISGAADRRPDLDRLVALAVARAFDEVRVRHVDRLTRHPDPRQRAAILGVLIDAGAKVVEASGREIDPADEMGELDLTLQGWIAARERKRILERTLAARKRLAAQGKIQGRPPYARTWDKATGVWGEDPARMAVYRSIFQDVLKSRSLAEVATRLNRDGVTTPRGREWTPAHVSRLVRARSATGRLEGWGHIYRIPAVVDEPTWRAAIAKLRASGTRSGPPGRHQALLRRVLVCGICGSRMWVQRAGKTGDVRTYYVCSTHRRTTDAACRKYHAASELDEAVKAHILEELRQPARLRAAAARHAPRDAAGDARAEVERAEKELRDLDRREESLARLTTKGALSERVGLSQLAEIAKLRNAAEVALASATARAEALEGASKAARDFQENAAHIAEKLERASFDAWRRFIAAQFPVPACCIRLFPDGRTVLEGLHTLGQRVSQKRHA